MPNQPTGPATGPNTTKLTMRLAIPEIEAFRTLCQRLDMTQRDALMYLIQLHSGSDCLVEVDVLRKHQHLRRQIDKLQAENAKLLRRIERLQQTPEALAPRMTQRLQQAQADLNTYCQAMSPPQGASLPCMSYTRYGRLYPELHHYAYHAHDDAFVFTPNAILYGVARPPVQFWIGWSAKGEPCKIRIYHKHDHLGISPLHHKYAVIGVKWLIRTRTAADGAEDLIFAMPFPAGDGTPIIEPTSPNANDLTAKLPLAQRIAAAERRSNLY